MKKFRVTAAIPVFVSIEVEAENEEDAIEAAHEGGFYLTSFIGNGGSDKLVGVCGNNMSVEPGEEVLDSGGFNVEATEL